MLTPKEIGEKTFEKTFGFGYRMDDVDAFLEQAAKSLAEQQRKNAEMEKKLEVLADKLTEYREDEESLRTALLGAQKLGDSVIRESKTKAEIVLRDATIKAEAMVSHAKRQIEEEQTNLEKIQQEVGSFKSRLLDMYKQHIELISTLPGSFSNAPAARGEKTSEPVSDEQHDDDAQVEKSVEAYDDEQEQIEEQDESFVHDDEDDIEPKASEPSDDPEFDEDFIITDDSDDDEQYDENTPTDSRFSDMRFGEAFKIKRNDKPLFRK